MDNLFRIKGKIFRIFFNSPPFSFLEIYEKLIQFCFWKFLLNLLNCSLKVHWILVYNWVVVNVGPVLPDERVRVGEHEYGGDAEVLEPVLPHKPPRVQNEQQPCTLRNLNYFRRLSSSLHTVRVQNIEQPCIAQRQPAWVQKRKQPTPRGTRQRSE